MADSILTSHILYCKLYSIAEANQSMTNIFSYSDPIAKKSILGDKPDKPSPISISKIVYSSDASPSTLSATMPEPSLSVHVNSTGDTIQSSGIPSIGDGIAIWSDVISVDKSIDSAFIFRGYITSVSRRLGDDGVHYSIEAKDMKVRLQDQVIKKVYNASYKRAATPNVKENNSLDNPYTTERMTVDDILEDILKYGTMTSFSGNNDLFIGYEYSDFDYNGNTYLKNFIPQTLSFDNCSILEAIFRLINTAGSHRLIYNPSTDKFIFAKISSDCRNCGNKIPLVYGDGDIGHSNVNVISDTTSRKTGDIANILKAYSAHIEWYSGHFYLRRGWINSGLSSGKFYLKSKNFDGYNYFFGLNSIPHGLENINEPYVLVGCPLYPIVDPRKGYNPQKEKFSKILKVVDNKYIATDANIEYYNGFSENDRKYIEDRSFTDIVGKDSFSSAAGLTYEAYVPYGVCECCGGSGAVEEYTSEFQYFGNTRDMQGNKINYPACQPFVYNFATVNGGKFSEYVGSNEQIPQRHPLPWKNTCPVCRGTGMEPWFKMTTLLTTLVDLTPEQTKIGEANTKNATNDNAVAPTQKDKTWADIASDMTYRYPLTVQVERSTSYASYNRNEISNESEKIKHSLYESKQSDGGNILIFKTKADASGESYKESEGQIDKLYYTQVASTNDYSIDVDRGLIIFKNAQFVTCQKPMKNLFIEMAEDQNKRKHACIVCDDKNNPIYKSRGDMNGVGNKVLGFWRPARAWISCYFKRDMLKTYIGQYSSHPRSYYTSSTNTSLTKRIDEVGEIDQTFDVCPKIEDNRYCAEIRMRKGSSGTEPFTVRPISKGVTMDNYKWQLHPWDFGKFNSYSAIEVPNTYDNLWKDVYNLNISNNYVFPCGKFQSIEPLRESEALSLYSAEELENVLKGDVRGKIISWVHRDDRIKLFEKATEDLDRRNDIQINGSVDIKGIVSDFSKGFGWVTLFDGKKASVVRLEVSFSPSAYTSLEVGTEEFRLGQSQEKDQDYQRKIDSQIEDLNTKRESYLVKPLGNGDSDNTKKVLLGAISIER